ncbi:MAG TPA: hypothetical protein VGG19_05990 [Tepidisphaeraceae bacterium]|jgi:hypothetical protein
MLAINHNLIAIIEGLPASSLNVVAADPYLANDVREFAAIRRDSLVPASSAAGKKLAARREHWKSIDAFNKSSREKLQGKQRGDDSPSLATPETQHESATDRLVASAQKGANGHLCDRTEAKKIADYEWRAGDSSAWRKKWGDRREAYITARSDELQGFVNLLPDRKP